MLLGFRIAHVILSTSWYTRFTPTVPQNKKKKRKIYLYEKTSQQEWKDFSNETQQILNRELSNIRITQADQLDKHWHVWSSAVKRAADAHIPITYKKPRTFYAMSMKATRLHTALKHINKSLHKLVNITYTWLPSYQLLAINKNLHKALSSAQIPKFSITPLALTTIVAPNNKFHYANTITNIKELKTTI